MGGLDNKQIALLGTRKIEEQATIIQHLGGSAIHRPAQGTIYFDANQIGDQIKKLINGQFQWVIFTTGIGIDKLFEIAVEMNLEEALQGALEKTQIAIRGYKTRNAVKKRGLSVVVRDDDGSISGLIRELKSFDLTNQSVAVQLYGDPSPELIHWLTEQQATIEEILPYQHIPPENDVLTKLLNEILTNQIDAVSFTSTPQVRYLFQFAEENNLKHELLNAFESTVIALSVGKVTGKALEKEGVKRVLMPQDERMGSALMTLSNYYKQKISKTL